MVQAHREMQQLEQDQQGAGAARTEAGVLEGGRREATPETALACLGWPLPVI